MKLGKAIIKKLYEIVDKGYVPFEPIKANDGWRYLSEEEGIGVVRLDKITFESKDMQKIKTFLFVNQIARPDSKEKLELLNQTMNQWYKEGKLGTPEYDQLVNQINEIEHSLKDKSEPKFE